jgi:hypothetical protein
MALVFADLSTEALARLIKEMLERQPASGSPLSLRAHTLPSGRPFVAPTDAETSNTGDRSSDDPSSATGAKK